MLTFSRSSYGSPSKVGVAPERPLMTFMTVLGEGDFALESYMFQIVLVCTTTDRSWEHVEEL